jgi:hypothetical protein
MSAESTGAPRDSGKVDQCGPCFPLSCTFLGRRLHGKGIVIRRLSAGSISIKSFANVLEEAEIAQALRERALVGLPLHSQALDHSVLYATLKLSFNHRYVKSIIPCGNVGRKETLKLIC